MFEFLSSPFFKYIILPLLTVALTIFIKVSSRPDKQTYVTREDFAVGINLCVTAIFVLVTKCVIISGNLVGNIDSGKIERYLNLLLTSALLSSAMIVSVFVLSFFIRRNAWEYDMRRMKMTWGVVIPDIVGLVFLVFASAQPVE